MPAPCPSSSRAVPVRLLQRHPFVTLALASLGLLLALMLWDNPPATFAQNLGMLWRIVGWPFHFIANLLAREAPGLPGWLDATLVVALGILPYVAADCGIRLWQDSRRR